MVEILIGRGDGMGNRTTDLEVRSPTLTKMSDTVTTPQRSCVAVLLYFVVNIFVLLNRFFCQQFSVSFLVIVQDMIIFAQAWYVGYIAIHQLG